MLLREHVHLGPSAGSEFRTDRTTTATAERMRRQAPPASGLSSTRSSSAQIPSVVSGKVGGDEDDDAAGWDGRRTSAAEEETECEPLPGLLKVVTAGKELIPSKKHIFENGLEGTCAAVNPSGDTVAVGCRNSNILLLDVANLQTMSVLDLGLKGDGTITALTYRPDTLGNTQNVALISRADSVLNVHTSTGKVLLQRQEEGNKINTMCLRPSDGLALATAGADTLVRVYDEASGRLTATLEHGDNVITTGHSNAVYSLAWVPDQPQVVVSAGWDRSVKVWDLRSQRVVRSVFGPYICGDSISVRGTRLLTGSWRHSQALQQWDLASGRLMTNMTFFQPEHEACLIYCAKFAERSMDGIIYAGGSGKRPVLRTYQARGEIMGTMQLHTAVVGVAQVNDSPKHKSLLVCCSDRLLNLDL